MKQQINEIKRMQQLAGVLNEMIDLTDEGNILNIISTTMSEENMSDGDKEEFLHEIIKYCQQELAGVIKENEQSAFEKGAPEDEYDLEDCLFEIGYNCDMAKKSENPGDYLSSIIHFAELAKTKI